MSQSKQSARVYLKSGVRLSLIDVEGDPIEAVRRGRAIVGTNVSDGQRTAIAGDTIDSVSTDAAVPNPAIFWGRKIEIRAAAGFKNEDLDDPHSDAGLVRDMVSEDRMTQTAVLVAEDLASAVVVIYDLGKDDAVWVNPASSPEAIEYAVQAIKLLAVGEQVEQAFQEEGIAESEALSVRRKADVEVAKARFREGNVAAAHESDPAQAERSLAAEVLCDREVEVRLSGLLNGWVGTVTGYEEPKQGRRHGRFAVTLTRYNDRPEPTAPKSVRVTIDDVVTVTCWDVGDRRAEEQAIAQGMPDGGA